MLTGMERPNWVYWKDQGKWYAHPENAPDRKIQTASFEELELKVQQLSREVTRSHPEAHRVERQQLNTLNFDPAQYVLVQDQGKWRGHLLACPEHSAQGESFDEVQFKLYQLCRNLNSAKQLPPRKAA